MNRTVEALKAKLTDKPTGGEIKTAEVGLIIPSIRDRLDDDSVQTIQITHAGLILPIAEERMEQAGGPDFIRLEHDLYIAAEEITTGRTPESELDEMAVEIACMHDITSFPEVARFGQMLGLGPDKTRMTFLQLRAQRAILQQPDRIIYVSKDTQDAKQTVYVQPNLPSYLTKRTGEGVTQKTPSLVNA